MILVHFVEVRILTGLPFFCLFAKIVSNPGKKHSVALANSDLPRNRVFFLPRSFLPQQKWDYSLSRGCLVLLDLRSAMLRLTSLRSCRILTGLPFFFALLSE